MNKRRLVMWVLVASLLLGLTLNACAWSVITYDFHSTNQRQLDWQIARVLQFGEPEQNHYYNYYVYDNDRVNLGNETIVTYQPGSSSTVVDVDSEMEEGYLGIITNSDWPFLVPSNPWLEWPEED